jgi:hypothetical protein
MAVEKRQAPFHRVFLIRYPLRLSRYRMRKNSHRARLKKKPAARWPPVMGT